MDQHVRAKFPCYLVGDDLAEEADRIPNPDPVLEKEQQERRKAQQNLQTYGLLVTKELQSWVMSLTIEGYNQIHLHICLKAPKVPGLL